MKVQATITATINPDRMRQLIRNARECQSTPIRVLQDLLQDWIKDGFDEFENVKVEVACSSDSDF